MNFINNCCEGRAPYIPTAINTNIHPQPSHISDQLYACIVLIYRKIICQALTSANKLRCFKASIYFIHVAKDKQLLNFTSSLHFAHVCTMICTCKMQPGEKHHVLLRKYRVSGLVKNSFSNRLDVLNQRQ